jgi:hypothetical protein
MFNTRGTTQIAKNRHSGSDKPYALTQQSRGGSNKLGFHLLKPFFLPARKLQIKLPSRQLAPTVASLERSGVLSLFFDAFYKVLNIIYQLFLFVNYFIK